MLESMTGLLTSARIVYERRRFDLGSFTGLHSPSCLVRSATGGSPRTDRATRGTCQFSAWSDVQVGTAFQPFRDSNPFPAFAGSSTISLSCVTSFLYRKLGVMLISYGINRR